VLVCDQFCVCAGPEALLSCIPFKPFTHPTIHLLQSSRQQPDDLVIDAVVVLLREHGLMDAKAMVAADASVLVPAAEQALVSGLAVG